MPYKFNPFTSALDKVLGLLTQLRATANRMFYSGSDGRVTELPFGDSGKVLTSTGTGTAPVWAVAGSVSIDTNLDGGFANSTYLSSQSVDGGGA